jgi:N-acetylglucosamine malate deacetylase 1
MIPNVDILGIGAHPDDVELSASGTLLAHRVRGYTFGLLDLTRGELGSRGSIKIRRGEAKSAAQVLNAAFRHGLQLPDGFLQVSDREQLMPIIAAIRACQPSIVLANAPDDRHPDHSKAAKLVAEAAFLSGLAKIETFDPITNEKQAAWRPKSLYHYIQDRQLSPDFVVDITAHWDQKMEAILSFKSQFFHPDSSEPSTPISSKEFLDFMEAKARVFGREAGYTYAEGFVKSRIFGVKNMMDLD